MTFLVNTSFESRVHSRVREMLFRETICEILCYMFYTEEIVLYASDLRYLSVLRLIDCF